MGFVDGIPASQIAARVLEDPALARHFDTDASPSFVRGLLERAVEETLTVRRNRGFAVD